MGTSAAVTVPEPTPAPAPARREPARAVVAGVCARLGERLGIDPLILRIGFLATAALGGIGIAVYALCWAAMPGTGRFALRGRRQTVQIMLGSVLLVLAALFLLRAWGLWVGDVVVWPLLLASGGAALIWRESQGAEMVAPPPPPPAGGAEPDRRRTPPRLRLHLERPAQGVVWLGVALVVGAGLVFLWLTGALVAARDVVLAVLVVLIALALLLAPWWLRLARGLTAEREARIRSQERAEVAAHLHDSVLQTLALMQKRADDPREVAALARRQERELRAWLNAGTRRRAAERSFAAALEHAVAEIEDAHGVPVDVVAVGDRTLDDRTEALVAATREAVLNAVKFAPDAPITVYAEVEGERVEVFVRDRGPGFDPARVPADRRGLRESVLGRMERHGGRAAIHSTPGLGTEVELVVGEP
jgi:phage shock protein PspC (stress-responsive transcriptional regulator)